MHCDIVFRQLRKVLRGLLSNPFWHTKVSGSVNVSVINTSSQFNFVSWHGDGDDCVEEASFDLVLTVGLPYKASVINNLSPYSVVLFFLTFDIAVAPL